MAAHVHFANAGESKRVERVSDCLALWIEQAAARDDVNGDSKPRHAVGSSGSAPSVSSRPLSTDATIPQIT